VKDSTGQKLAYIYYKENRDGAADCGELCEAAGASSEGLARGSAHAYDDRHHERPNEIFLPGWPERNLGHSIRFYGLCTVNQRVRITKENPTHEWLSEKTRN